MRSASAQRELDFSGASASAVSLSTIKHARTIAGLLAAEGAREAIKGGDVPEGWPPTSRSESPRSVSPRSPGRLDVQLASPATPTLRQRRGGSPTTPASLSSSRSLVARSPSSALGRSPSQSEGMRLAVAGALTRVLPGVASPRGESGGTPLPERQGPASSPKLVAWALQSLHTELRALETLEDRAHAAAVGRAEAEARAEAATAETALLQAQIQRLQAPPAAPVTLPPASPPHRGPAHVLTPHAEAAASVVEAARAVAAGAAAATAAATEAAAEARTRAATVSPPSASPLRIRPRPAREARSQSPSPARPAASSDGGRRREDSTASPRRRQVSDVVLTAYLVDCAANAWLPAADRPTRVYRPPDPKSGYGRVAAPPPNIDDSSRDEPHHARSRSVDCGDSVSTSHT